MTALPARPDIDPEIQAFLDAMRADWAAFPPFDTLPLPERRAAAEKVRARWTAGGPVMARTVEEMFEAGGHALRVRVHVPEGAPDPAPALVYLHGGGFTLFSIDTHDRLAREYAAAGGFTVIALDYPLSPEYKYPAALDYILAFVLALRRNAPRWGVDPARIAIGGDSAGGNLAFAVCLRLRDMGRLDAIRAVLSNYGGFSARISDESEARFGGPDAILNRAEAEGYWANYLRDERDAHDPYACPIHADLTDFPPVFLATPECDLVAEHSLRMAERLREAGVAMRGKLYKGATHSFLEAMAISALARRAIAEGAYFVRDRLFE